MNTSFLLRRYNTEKEVQVDIVELNAAVFFNLQHTTRCGKRFDLTKPDGLDIYINCLQDENLEDKKVTGGWFSVRSTRTARELVGRLSGLFREPASEDVLKQIVSAEKAAQEDTTLVKTWTIEHALNIKGQEVTETRTFVEVPMQIMGRFLGR